MNGILFKPAVWKGKQKALKQFGVAQTRRTDGLKEINKAPDEWEIVRWNGEYTRALNGGFQFASNGGLKAIKPRYHVGEKLYVKEPFYAFGEWVLTGKKTKNGRNEVRTDL